MEGRWAEIRDGETLVGFARMEGGRPVEVRPATDDETEADNRGLNVSDVLLERYERELQIHARTLGALLPEGLTDGPVSTDTAPTFRAIVPTLNRIRETVTKLDALPIATEIERAGGRLCRAVSPPPTVSVEERPPVVGHPIDEGERGDAKG